MTVTAQWGTDQSRTATTADAIDGLVPAVVLEPRDLSALCEMLRWANAEKLSIVPRGGGTKLCWGSKPTRLDAVLSTALLPAPVEHCAGDLTVSMAASARLASVNRLLADDRQWLPLDPSFPDRATIGGIVATNDSGPRRHRYGTPRDLIIGVEVALADGRTAKGGGRVVKNVAGYDLPRLLCGSFGSLAIITRTIFKLVPIASASRTLVATADRARQLTDLALAVAAAPLTASAIELQSHPWKLLVRIESSARAVDQQAAIARKLAETSGTSIAIATDDAEAALWRKHEDHLPAFRDLPPTVVRLSALPTQLGELVDIADRVLQQAELEWRLVGRAALGVVYVAINGSAGQDISGHIAAVIKELRRQATTRGGSAVVVSTSPAVKTAVDPWGDMGDALKLMRAVKARFDPNDVLNPGRAGI